MSNVTRVVCLVGAVGLLGCTESRQLPGADGGLPPGTELGPCYGNNTCNPGLTCASGICVRLAEAGPFEGGTECGDGVINGAERCDKTDLGGKSCSSLGFAGGVLACKFDCTFDTSSCFSNPFPDSGPKDIPMPGDLPPTGDLPPLVDLPGYDWAKPDLPGPTCDSTLIGTPCTATGTQCGPTMVCAITDASYAKGVCSCKCTPDDPSTPLVIEDSCPDLKNNRCGTLTSNTGTPQNYCFRLCTPALNVSACAGDVACLPESGQALDLFGEAVCAFYGCTNAADCPVLTSTTCSMSSPACPAGQKCVPVADGATAGRCTVWGTCDPISNLCGLKPKALSNANAKVGDPCDADTDCGQSMFCRLEVNTALFKKKSGAVCTADKQCCSGECQTGKCTAGLCTVDNRNGYCAIRGCIFKNTLPIRNCTAGSTCNRLYPGGLCLKTCSLNNANACRGHAADLFGDYECRDWSNLIIGGQQISVSPVCDSGTAMPCNFFGNNTALNCSHLGLKNNPTKMSCRSLDNKVLPNQKDPTGYCLDNTASGTAFRSPLPTP